MIEKGKVSLSLETEKTRSLCGSHEQPIGTKTVDDCFCENREQN